MTEENSNSDYHSENDRVSELEILRETLNNHNIEWPEIVDESECSSHCYLASIAECCEEINENDQIVADVGERKVKMVKGGEIEEAGKRLEKASKLLDDGKLSLSRFLQMLDLNGEWFPEDSKLSFEFEEENVENDTIESILKDYYGPDWSSPFQFEFIDNVEV